MSNVLMGIIGVTLFIGLALAGALFLGPRFSAAQASSEASGYMLQLKQITDAAVMRTFNGAAMVGDTEADITRLKTEGYLKGDLAGFDFSDLTESSFATVAYRALPDNAKNRAVCLEIQRIHGQTVNGTFDATPKLMRETTTQHGCIVWRYRANSLAVFVKI